MSLFDGKLAWRRVALAIAALWIAAPGIGQTTATSGIEGVWEPARSAMLAPADGKQVPFTAEGRARFRAHRAAAAKGDYTFDASMSRCASPGQPRLMMTPMPFAIFVRPRMVTMLYQWNRLFRQIAVGKSFISPALGDKWWSFGLKQGHSQAVWQGDMLVVHTDSFLDEGLLDGLLPASDQLELTERIRLRGPDTLEDRITIKDPVNYTRPWNADLTFARSGQSLPFPEDVCLDRLHGGQPPLPKEAAMRTAK